MLTPFDAFALATVVLFLKIAAVGAFQGKMRKDHGAFERPSDAEFFADGGDAVADEPLPIVDRAQRALRNDVENIPIFLFLAWCFVELNVWPAGAPIYFGVFVVARIAHTIFYLRALQPHRTISYVFGLLVSVALSGHILYAVFVG